MSSLNAITPAQLARLVGLPDAPVIIDVRIPDDVAADPRTIPASIHRRWQDAPTLAATWATTHRGRAAVVVCQRGHKLSEGAAAWLRHEGVRAENLEGGFEAWRNAALSLLRPEAMPPFQDGARSVWVTRARPKIDRIACPWLIRRFIDPAAVFLFVSPAEVADVAARFAATPFDIEGVFWSHTDPGTPGERCTFDTMLHNFGLSTPPLERLARIVRGADTARLDLAPEAAGLLAASLGLSRMHRDDLVQLEAGLTLYDAFYRWCRDATDETHIWPAPRTASVPA